MSPFRFLSQKREESLEITVEHLENFLTDKLKQHVAPLCVQAEKNRNRLKAHLSDLKSVGLEIADFEPRIGEIEAPFEGAINATKEALATAVMKEWTLSSNSPTSFEDILKLRDEAEVAVKHLLNVCAANRKIAYTFLKGYIKKLEGKIKSIADEVASLDKLIEKHHGGVESWKQVLRLAQEFADLIRKGSESEERVKLLRSEIAGVDTDISEFNLKLQSWLQDPQYLQIEKSENELGQLDEEIERLMLPMKETLASLRRTFDKYRYLVSGDKLRVKLLKDFEDLGNLLNRTSYDDLAGLLSDIEKRITEGDIQLKNSSKIVASVSNLATDLPMKAVQYRGLQHRVNEVKERLMSSPRSTAKNLQTNLDELKASKVRLENEVESVSQLRALDLAQAAQKVEQLKDGFYRIVGLKLKIIDRALPVELTRKIDA